MRNVIKLGCFPIRERQIKTDKTGVSLIHVPHVPYRSIKKLAPTRPSHVPQYASLPKRSPKTRTYNYNAP